MARPDEGNPLRTGIFGIVLVACLVLVSFGYTSLPFWPHEAYFTDAGGISPGNDVNVSGINVGKVTGVALAGDTAKVTFTVNRDVKVGDQSLVAIKTDTVGIMTAMRSKDGCDMLFVPATWATRTTVAMISA